MISYCARKSHTGQEDIETLTKLLQARAKVLPPAAMKLFVCQLYAALPPEQQMQVFERTYVPPCSVGFLF